MLQSRNKLTVYSPATVRFGYHIAHEGHHKHTLYLIKHSELTGFSEAERDLIANVARYHRGSPPKDKHADYAGLGQKDKEIVRRHAAILRVAEALDRGHDSRVRELLCARDSRTVKLRLSSGQDCRRRHRECRRR